MAPGILLDRCMGVLRVARSTSFVVHIDRQSRGSKKRLGVWTYKTCVFKRGFECRNQMHCFRTFASSSQAAGGLLLCFRLWCTVHAERPRYNTPHFRARPGSVARVLGVQSCASKAIETKMSVFFCFRSAVAYAAVPPLSRLYTLRRPLYNGRRASSFPLCGSQERCFCVCAIVGSQDPTVGTRN